MFNTSYMAPAKSTSKPSFAGNEVEEATANFAFDDEDDKPLSASVKADETPAKEELFNQIQTIQQVMAEGGAVLAVLTFQPVRWSAVSAVRSLVECLSAFIGLVIAVARPSIASFRHLCACVAWI